ncbi:MAG: hypothetical protein F4Z35_04745 [Dehalococcoidia bacterium]|nr:hypothetical protein [Dehalococcoidia bacterium]
MTPYPELQQIIREETDNGRGIVQFLFKAMWGEFHNFTPQHQLMAGRALAIIGVEQGVQFVEANRPPSLPRNTPQRRIVDDELDTQLSAAERELIGYARKTTRSGRKMVRFFLDAMNGLIKSFSPSLRIAAAKELIGCAFPLLVPVKRRKTTAPKPQTAPASQPETQPQSAQAAPVASLPSVQLLNGHPERCSCRTCERSAMDRFRQTHCQEGEDIHQYIARRAFTATSDDGQLMIEATLIWNEYMAFIRKLCPTALIAPIPAWYSRLLERDPHYHDGYNPKLVDKHYDFWMNGGLDDDDWDDAICYCENCDDDHERDKWGYCRCPECFDDEDDP